MHKANTQNVASITMFAAAVTVLGTAVTIGADGLAAAPDAGKMPDGIVMEGAVKVNCPFQASQPGQGVHKALAGSDVARGDDLSVGAGGRFNKAAAGEDIVGKAVTAGAADEYIGILFNYRGAAA